MFITYGHYVSLENIYIHVDMFNMYMTILIWCIPIMGRTCTYSGVMLQVSRYISWPVCAIILDASSIGK